MVAIHVLLSVLFAFSLAVVVVEKGEDWPISLFVRRLRWLLSRINTKLAGMLDCTVCFSFWASLVGEIFLVFVTGSFMWPFTGIIAVGFTWFMIELLNSIDKTRNNSNDQTH